jgi:hypothetical protein
VQFVDHFGYANKTSLGSQYADNKYAAITRFDRVIYSTVWKEVGRFNDSDFEKLEQDFTVNKLYANGETDVYYVISIIHN